MDFEPLSEQQLEALRQIDTCTICNAIERFGVRLHNEGFADSSIRCMFEDMPPMVGYAITALLRTGSPPIEGGSYHDRTDWWRSILQVPPPRIVVLQDVGRRPGFGAFLGDVHAAILKALGCVGYVTNGGVRELPEVRSIGLHLFAGNIALSHAYAHIFEIGAPVEIGGLQIHPGDLLHGDRHGIISIPKTLAAQIPEMAAKLKRNEQEIIKFCGSTEFSVEELRELTKKQH